jgi:large subunit ribosomal protein L18
MAMQNKTSQRRTARVRRSLKRAANGRVRLSVFRSSKHIYAQLIDDANGVTLASASTMDKDVRSDIGNGGNREAAAKIGELIAVKAKDAGVNQVVFDRGPYLYHGRLKALAEAAREGGLEF